MEIDYLGVEGTKKLIDNINLKLDKSQIYPLTIDEYNDLYEEDKLDDNTLYLIIDSDDSLFNKITELETNLQKALDFIEQFPASDNRTYGIINRYPKYLNIPELDNDPRDRNDQETEEEPVE